MDKRSDELQKAGGMSFSSPCWTTDIGAELRLITVLGMMMGDHAKIALDSSPLFG